MKRSPATPGLARPTLVALLVPTAADISFSRTGHAQSSEAALTEQKAINQRFRRMPSISRSSPRKENLKRDGRVLGERVVPSDSAAQPTSLRDTIFCDNGRSTQT